MFFMRSFEKFFLLTVLAAPLFSQTKFNNDFIDPEIQNYFEMRYGYKNPAVSKDSAFRDSPITQVNENALFKNASIQTGYKSYRKELSEPLPLYYSVKKAYDSGPISSCVIEPDKENSAFLQKYSAVEIVVLENNWQDVYEKVIQPAGFVLGGEEYTKEGKTRLKTLIGWIPEAKMPLLMGKKGIKSVYFSKGRGLKAPPVRVSLILKAPSDRDPAVFAQAFSGHLASIGFNAGEVKNVIAGQNARFYLIEIDGSIPIDKTAQVLADPFILKLTPQKGI